ncbi:hypothetical protein P3342_003129 [Pyrenophora teres f. teres]|nr:hypothetical protein P3342_003129 [Pyrenophora teres f. teres]
MQAVQASPEDAHPRVSPPRQNPKGSGLASITISSFAAFRSQSSQPVPIAVQSPVRRKPLPADSPVVTRFSAQQPKNADDPLAVYNDLTPTLTRTSSCPEISTTTHMEGPL